MEASKPGALQNNIGLLQLVSSLIALAKSNSGILIKSSLNISFNTCCMLLIIRSGLNTNNKIDLHNPSNIFLSCSVSKLSFIFCKNSIGTSFSAKASFMKLFHESVLDNISFNKDVKGSFLFNSEICFL